MLSPNMLKTFQTCQKKYYLKYVKNITIPQKLSHFEKGKKIHALANYYLRGDDITKFEQTLNNEEKTIWNLLKNNEYFQKTYVNSEYNISCKVGNYWLTGRLDAIVKDEKNYYILDYKTGAIPKNPEYDFQTIVYLLAFNKMGFNNNLYFVYIDLKNNKNHIIEYKNEKEYEDKIIKICNDIEKYEPKENFEQLKICDLCEYKKICHLIQ